MQGRRAVVFQSRWQPPTQTQLASPSEPHARFADRPTPSILSSQSSLALGPPAKVKGKFTGCRPSFFPDIWFDSRQLNSGFAMNNKS